MRCLYSSLFTLVIYISYIHPSNNGGAQLKVVGGRLTLALLDMMDSDTSIHCTPVSALKTKLIHPGWAIPALTANSCSWDWLAWFPHHNMAMDSLTPQSASFSFNLLSAAVEFIQVVQEVNNQIYCCPLNGGDEDCIAESKRSQQRLLSSFSLCKI